MIYFCYYMRMLLFRYFTAPCHVATLWYFNCRSYRKRECSKGEKFHVFAHVIAMAKLLCQNNGATQVLVSVSTTPWNFSPAQKYTGDARNPQQNIPHLRYMVICRDNDIAETLKGAFAVRVKMRHICGWPYFNVSFITVLSIILSWELYSKFR